MKEILTKYKKWLLPGALFGILMGAALVLLALTQPITIVIDGEMSTVRTTALRVSGILRSAGVFLDEADHVTPPHERFLLNPSGIYIERAHDFLLMTSEDAVTLRSIERMPANLLSESGILLFPQDRVLLNGDMIDPHTTLNRVNGTILLQYQPAVPMTVIIEDFTKTFYTSKPTIGEALEAASVQVTSQDWISEDLMAPVDAGMDVSIRRAKPVKIHLLDSTFTGLTASNTVGEALQDVGITLQNLDYSIPPEDDPLPEDGQITIVRVREEIHLMTDEVAYSNETVLDPDTPLDEVSVVESGQVGIFATRDRIRYAGGEEVWRDAQENWQASEAQDGVLGYGTQAVVRTAVVDGQEIEYWRKISVYATSYSPCRCGLPDGACCYGSASGLPTQKGLIAVTPNWFNMMRLQPVFVQGYGRGVIGNVGGGAKYFNHYWIDLGYSDDDYVSWHHWTTMYFLTPVPEWYPAILPWP